jgi:cytochrome c553
METEKPPPGSRRGLLALGVAVLVAIVMLLLLAGRSRIPPDLSPTLEHRAALGSRDAQACISCHHAGATAMPRPNGHTPRQDCWSCHAIAEPPSSR